MNELFDKLQIISHFLEINGIDHSETIASFNAFVEYVTRDISDNTIVMMKLDNMQYGDIEIMETTSIDLKKMHTGFKVEYNDYYLSDKTLIIKGVAHPSKGGMQFIVKITPVIKKTL